ncbi:MAG TPA: O-antigen ligase family protein [Gammaproteobacteria bacterium]|nr:O-antigen ligase family protein [Gammaproteobacteria bacterium]
MRQLAPLRLDWANRAGQVLTALAVVATAALALVIDRVDSYSLLALLIVGVYLGFRYGFGRGLRAGEKLLIWAVAAYFAVALFAYLNGLQTNLGFRVLGRYLRFVILIPAYLALRRLTPPGRVVWLALVAGSLVAAGSALAQYFASGGVSRAAGDSIAITFGDLALMTGFAAMVMTPPLRGRWRWVALVAGVLALAGGMTASILSGTRGGWLAIPVYAALAMAALTRGMAVRWRVAIGAAAVAIVAAVVAVPATGVWPRINAAIESWHQYGYYRDEVAALPAAGCISARPLIEGLAAFSIARGAQIEAVDDAGALAAAGFAGRCPGGTALHITNPDRDHDQWVRIPRIVSHANMPGFAAVLARGDGQVRVVGISPEHVSGPDYRQTVIAGEAQDFRRYVTLDVHLPPGGEMYLVPLQVNPGAYRYFYTGTSVGTRLAMWGTAWDIFTDHWLTGIGTGAYRAAAGRRVDVGRAAPITAMYDHPHNQYLNALASRGVIGLIELLLLLGVPAWLFAMRFGAPDGLARRSAYAGMVTVSGFTIFGLTETIFNHSLTIGYYVIFVGTFAALMYRAEEAADPVKLPGSILNSDQRSDG